MLISTSFVVAPSYLNEINYIKSFVSYSIAILITLFIFIGQINKNENSPIILSYIDILTCILFLSCAIFIGKRDFTLITSIFIYYIGCSILLKSLLHTNTLKVYSLKQISTLISIVVGIHVILAFLQKLGIAPSFHDYFTGGSTFGNPDMLGSYLAFLIPFCFYSNKKGFRYKYLVVLATIILLITIQTRTALLSLLLCLILWIRLNKKIKSKTFFLLLISFSFLLIIGLIYWNPTSVYGRLFIWYICIMMILKKPFGWGEFAFSKHFNEFQAVFLSENSSSFAHISYDVVHSPFNEFLFIGVRLGIIPLLIYILLIIITFWFLIKRNNKLIYPLLVFLTVSLTYFPFKIAPLLILVIPILTLVSIQNKPIVKLFIPNVIRKSGITLLLITSTLLLFHHTKEFLEFKKWQNGVIYSLEKNKISKAESIFEELYPKMNTNGRFLITFSNLKYIQGDKLTSLKLLELADNYFCDIVFCEKIAKLYHELGHYEKAEEKFILAENIAPDRFLSSYERVLFYINTNQDFKAYKLCKELLNRPIKKQTYADPYIVKSKIKEIISMYESNKINIIIDN